MGVLYIALQTLLKTYRKEGEIENILLFNHGIDLRQKKSFWTQFKKCGTRADTAALYCLLSTRSAGSLSEEKWNLSYLLIFGKNMSPTNPLLKEKASKNSSFSGITVKLNAQFQLKEL